MPLEKADKPSLISEELADLSSIVDGISMTDAIVDSAIDMRATQIRSGLIQKVNNTPGNVLRVNDGRTENEAVYAMSAKLLLKFAGQYEAMRLASLHLLARSSQKITHDRDPVLALLFDGTEIQEATPNIEFANEAIHPLHE